jgi:hypothetical protein
MRQASGVVQVMGEMVSIVLLALTGRFIGFAQSTLESATPLTVSRALSYGADILALYARLDHVLLLVGVLVLTSLIGIAYANRSVLLSLRQRAGITEESLSWGQRAVRLPIAVVYRGLSGIATLVGAVALALCFRLFNPDSPFGFDQLMTYLNAIAGGISYATVGALLVLFGLYGVALAIIGYVASPAILTLEEMASGCRAEPAPVRPAPSRTAAKPTV